MNSALSVQQSDRWELHRLDWTVNFPRSPQHLSNQLRGKRVSSQLELFDDVFGTLKPEIQREVREKAISVVGFDLTINQQRAYEAGLRLLACSNYQHRRLVITPDDWLRAYDLQARQTSRGWKEISGQERADALRALIGLAGMPWLVSYKKQENGRWYLVQRVTTIWRLEIKTLLGDVAAVSTELPAGRVSDIERIAIEFDDVWFDQRDQYYFYKPAGLYTRIALSLPGKIRRQPQHLHPFLDWIFSEAGRLRVLHKNEPETGRSWVISARWTDLAHQCRMTGQLEHRNYARVRQSLIESAELAKAAQIISSYELQGELFVVTFNNRIFADLDDYLSEQKVKRERRKARGGEPSRSASTTRSLLWKDRSRFSLSEINRLITEHEEAIKAIRSRIPFSYNSQLARSVPEREFTTEESEHLEHHRNAIRELKEIKLGVRPLVG